MVIKRLYCGVQNYAWGKPGNSSLVAALGKNAVSEFELDETQPYAELWMGTHSKAPAIISDNGMYLEEIIINDSREVLGTIIFEQFGAKLPFLLKILSVNQALSIQAHPEKKHAEVLHAKDPAHYPDSNHKPEMCIALTEFTGLCGFRPQDETVTFCKNIPELSSLIGDVNLANANKEDYENLLKVAFTNLMNTSKTKIAEKASKLIDRVKSDTSIDVETKYLKTLLLTLNEKYSGDVGLFNIYFLNYMKLQPGEAMFLKANIPHAYLSGDCVECMACSDNVVRAGLTPKFMDVAVLCEMLNYSAKPAEDNKFIAESNVKGVRTFNPDIPDFALQEIKLGTGNHVLPSVNSASITIIVKGHGMCSNIELAPGIVIFASANEVLNLTIKENIIAYRALVL